MSSGSDNPAGGDHAPNAEKPKERDWKGEWSRSATGFALGLMLSTVVLTAGALAWLDGYIKKKVDEALEQRLPGTIRVDALPASAVVAFDERFECPTGWTSFDDLRGRTIIGAGQGVNLKAREFGVPGGKEAVPLTRAHLPKERIAFEYEELTDNKHESGGRRLASAVGSTAMALGPRTLRELRYTEPLGAGEALEVMPPFLPLRFCRRKPAP